MKELWLVEHLSKRGRRSASEITDHRHRGLLRAHSERPTSRRAAQQRDKLASLQER
jgi:hypothetical protein